MLHAAVLAYHQAGLCSVSACPYKRNIQVCGHACNKRKRKGAVPATTSLSTEKDPGAEGGSLAGGTTGDVAAAAPSPRQALVPPPLGAPPPGHHSAPTPYAALGEFNFTMPNFGTRPPPATPNEIPSCNACAVYLKQNQEFHFSTTQQQIRLLT